jgi:cell division protein FtsL
MSIDVEYAIKKDVRNNPVVRAVDLDQKREFFRTLCLAGLMVGMLLFSAFQHFEIVRHGYEVEDLRQQLLLEQSLHRRLRLELDTLQRPQDIERRARRELKLSMPTPADTLILERARPASASSAVVAEVR